MPEGRVVLLKKGCAQHVWRGVGFRLAMAGGCLGGVSLERSVAASLLARHRSPGWRGVV